MGCSGNNIQTSDEERENMNQFKNLANQQINAAEQIGNLGGQMIKNSAEQKNESSSIKNE